MLSGTGGGGSGSLIGAIGFSDGNEGSTLVPPPTGRPWFTAGGGVEGTPLEKAEIEKTQEGKSKEDQDGLTP